MIKDILLKNGNIATADTSDDKLIVEIEEIQYYYNEENKITYMNDKSELKEVSINTKYFNTRIVHEEGEAILQPGQTYYTVAKCANLRGIQVCHSYELISRRGIETVKIPNKHLLDERGMKEFIKRKRKKPSAK